MEKELSLSISNKNRSSSLFNLAQFLIDVFLLKNEPYPEDRKNDIIIKYSSIKNLLQGNNEEDKYWVNYISSGSYFDNFKPKFEHTTGLDIGINLDSKKQENFDFDYIGINTKISNYDKRRINKMNDLLTLNIKKDEYDYISDNYNKLFFPTFNFEKLLDTRKYSDGFQYDHELKVIYYYDTISSRPLRFKYSKEERYKGKIVCRRYDLDINELSIGINEELDSKDVHAILSQNVNKPFIITTNFEDTKSFDFTFNSTNINIDNYIIWHCHIHDKLYQFFVQKAK